MDARVVRTTGACVSITALFIAILGVIESTNDAAKWMALGLFVDFVLRFFAGSNASVLGSLAGVSHPPSAQFSARLGVTDLKRNMMRAAPYPTPSSHPPQLLCNIFLNSGEKKCKFLKEMF